MTDQRIARGMAVQFASRQQRLARGEKSLGWKVGFGTPAAMEKIGISEPLVGFLTDRALLSSGTSLALGDFIKPAVEPEVAVLMGADLAAGADLETARRAVAGLAPALEIADLTFPPEDPAAVLAGNIYQRHVILGAADETRAGLRLDGLTAHIRRDGADIARIDDIEADTGDLIDVVRHVADVLGRFDQTLRAGEWIITGSIIPPMWVEQAETIDFTLDPLPPISVRYTAS